MRGKDTAGATPTVSSGWRWLAALSGLLMVGALGGGIYIFFRVHLAAVSGPKEALPIQQALIAAVAATAVGFVSGLVGLSGALLQRGAQTSLARFGHESQLLLQNQRDQALRDLEGDRNKWALDLEAIRVKGAADLETKRTNYLRELEEHKTKLAATFDVARRRSDAYVRLNATAHRLFSISQTLASNSWRKSVALAAEDEARQALSASLLVDAEHKALFDEFVERGRRLSRAMADDPLQNQAELWRVEADELRAAFDRWLGAAEAAAVQVNGLAGNRSSA